MDGEDTYNQHERAAYHLFNANLNYHSLDLINLKIQEFKQLNFRKMSCHEISSALEKAISYSWPGGNGWCFNREVFKYEIGTRFYRVIPMPNYPIGLRVWHQSEFWKAPPDKVSMGRINKEREPLLYTSTATDVAIEECRMAEGCFMRLCVYEAKQEIRCVKVGFEQAYPYLSSENVLKQKAIDRFIDGEFKRVVTSDKYFYRITQAIIDDFYRLPDQACDAWCYRSIVKGDCINVCFCPLKENKLRLYGAMIGTYVIRDGVPIINAKLVGRTMNCGLMEWFGIGSDGQKFLFPEIIHET